MMVSWIWGISIGAAVSGIYLSIKYKTPVITAWSAPGTALLVTLFPNVSLNEAVAAYITSAIVIFNWRYRLLRQITKMDSARRRCRHDGRYSFQFGIGLFTASDSMPFIVLACSLSFNCQTFNAALHHDLGVNCRSFIKPLFRQNESG